MHSYFPVPQGVRNGPEEHSQPQKVGQGWHLAVCPQQLSLSSLRVVIP